jgi:ATP-binding cassette, subfamily B, bacterial
MAAYMLDEEKTASEWQTVVYFWHATLKHRRDFYLSLLLPLGAVFLNIILPFYTGKLLAALSVEPDHAMQYVPYLIVAAAIGVLSNRIGIARMARNQARTYADLQTTGLEHLLRQSATFHNDRVAGKLVTDAVDFPQGFLTLQNAVMTGLLPLGIVIFTGVVVVSVRSWELGIVLLGMAGLVIGSSLWHSIQRRSLRARRQLASKAMIGHLADVIVNNQTVKTFAKEDYELAKHHKLNEKLFRLRLHDWRLGGNAGNNRMIGLLCFQILFAFVIIKVVQHDPALLALGIFAFSYSVTMSNNLFNINTLIRNVEEALLQAGPMMSILQQAPSIVDKPGSSDLTVAKGEIAFKKVDFNYQENDSQNAVFSSLNLVIAPGEKVGLVGPSGGGKSTLTRLLLRFNDLQDGPSYPGQFAPRRVLRAAGAAAVSPHYSREYCLRQRRSHGQRSGSGRQTRLCPRFHSAVTKRL